VKLLHGIDRSVIIRCAHHAIADGLLRADEEIAVDGDHHLLFEAVANLVEFRVTISSGPGCVAEIAAPSVTPVYAKLDQVEAHA
jgi:hypothetical protein